MITCIYHLKHMDEQFPISQLTFDSQSTRIHIDNHETLQIPHLCELSQPCSSQKSSSQHTLAYQFCMSITIHLGMLLTYINMFASSI